MEQQAQKLPQGWIATALSEIAAIEAGNPAPQGEKYFKDGEFPFIRVQDMGQLNGSMVIRETRDKLNAAGIKNLKLFKKGSILFTKSGASTLLNQRAILGSDSYIVSHIGVAVPRADISSEWLYYFLKIIDFAHYAHGANMPSLPLSKVKEITVPLAPINEQKRIVDKIETLFSDLDKGEENLRTAQRLIASYRQSVLKAAVTGELTRDWREANKRRLEPGDKLLRCILKTRREQWKGRGKYQEPSAPDTANLPALSERWVWTSIDQLLIDSLTNGRSVRDADHGFPVLRLTALKNGKLDISERKVGAWTKEEAAPYLIQEGDFFASRGNGSRQLVGRGGLIVGKPDPVAFPDTLIRIRISKQFCKPEYFSWIWNSYFFRTQIERCARTTAGIYKINQQDISSFVFPLPSIGEQQEIVNKLEDIFSQITALEAWCATELARSTTLRQSILKAAFSGQLVPQDASDEPASELLKRIQAERASAPKAKPAAKRGRPGKRRAA